MRLALACVVASTAIVSAAQVAADPADQPKAAGSKVAQPPKAAQPQVATVDPAKSEAAKPDVATLLFGNPQWGKAPVRSTITYAYSKKTDDVKFGQSFDDTIKLKLDAGDDPESRTAEVRMFSGTNAKPAGPFRSDKQNPVLLLVFEENVQELSKLFKANPRYLKNAIRKAWREDAKIEATSVDVDGKSVPGTRITVTPFVNDAQKDKMEGLNGLSYTVEIADDTPGNIASIAIATPDKGGTPKFSETLRFKSEAKP